MDRARPFVQRQMLYARLDAEVETCTRFFAAAALTNAVFAQLFSVVPRRSLSRAHRFLREAGAVLESANLQFVSDIRQIPRGSALDQYLVSREQSLIQRLLEEGKTQAHGYDRRLCRELNGLLNGHPVAVLLSRLFTCSRRYHGILEKTRRELGLALNFANESHRIHIGLGLIRHIREDDACRASLAPKLSPH